MLIRFGFGLKLFMLRSLPHLCCHHEEVTPACAKLLFPSRFASGSEKSKSVGRYSSKSICVMQLVYCYRLFPVLQKSDILYLRRDAILKSNRARLL